MSSFRSTNPARPAEVVAEYPEHGAADVDTAVTKASEAQRAWARRPIPERAEAIAAVGAILTNRKAELAELVSREAGKIRIEGGGEVQEAIDMAAFVAGQGRNAMGEVVPSEMPSKMAYTTRIPVGVVGMITPWNFPMAIPSWKVFPALLAGNGVVMKPSELAPACGVAFMDACIEAGVPAGLLQTVHGGPEPAAALTVHPGVGAVSFTGSVPTGRKVAAAAMEVGPKLVSLELGGKNAMVVLDDADLDLVLEGALFGAFGTAGQRCTSTSRLIVQRTIATDVVTRLVERAAALRLGDPLDRATDVGPVITADSARRIVAMVEAAVSEGAVVATGGRLLEDVAGCDGGTFVTPTILTGVKPSHTVARQEVFGPVLSVIEVDDLDEAIDVVNAVEYGLSAAVYTQDINAALRAVAAIDTGITYVNAPTIGAEIPLPFGGTKHTGNGYREAGTRGIEQFSQVKTVYIDFSGRLQRAQIDNREDGAMTAIDTTLNHRWIERYDDVVAPVLPGYFDVVAERAQGSWVWDVDGHRYLDLGSGIAVTNTGHRHPHVVAAIHAQVDALLHTSVVLKHQPYIRACEAIAGLAPFLDRPQVFLCNSGGEAVDGAIKLARRTSARPGIVAFRRAFHGRTMGATSLTTAKASYQEGYGPLLPDVHIARYCTDGDTAGALAELDRLLATTAPPEAVAAMIVEPVLGEGGYVVPPVAWLEGLRSRCTEHGILLVFDEVQTGFGRTGRPFAAETFGVAPDVLLFAKGVASGLPLAGIMAGADLMARWPNGAHGSTFGGNPVSCAAAVATIEVLAAEGLYERAVVIGDRARTRLTGLRSPAIVEVRGVGAMIGVELVDKATAELVQRRCIDDGVLVLTCGPDGNVLRLIPPLTISDDELDHGIDVLQRALPT